MNTPSNESKKIPPKKTIANIPKSSKDDTPLSEHIIDGLDDIKEWDNQNLEHQYSLLNTSDKPISKIMRRRLMIHRLLLRGVSRHEMAIHFGVSLQTIYNDCSIINQQIKSEMQNIDLPAFVGTTVSFYDMLRNEATKIAFNEKLSVNDRLKAISTAKDIENIKQTYLEKRGLYMVKDTNHLFNKETQTDIAKELLDAISEVIAENKMESV